uniref:Thioredoxin-like 4, chloroplastic n=1 Tax=Oryza punctata TaxID=4537 RepID=A0A0E0K1D3_ORYPU
MITASLLPLPATSSSSSGRRSLPPPTTTFPRTPPLRRHRHRLLYSASASSTESEAEGGGSTNGSLPGLPPVVEEEEEEEFCPVECVTEFKTDDEFVRILERAKATGALVVVDFFRPSCGSCKYIEQGFMKLCKGSGDDGSPVVFLKHNVIDEYDEQSEVADRLRIKVVPLFHFYKDGVLLEAFATRDKERIIAAIQKYTSPSSPPSEAAVPSNGRIIIVKGSTLNQQFVRFHAGFRQITAILSDSYKSF